MVKYQILPTFVGSFGCLTIKFKGDIMILRNETLVLYYRTFTVKITFYGKEFDSFSKNYLKVYYLEEDITNIVFPYEFERKNIDLFKFSELKERLDEMYKMPEYRAYTNSYPDKTQSWQYATDLVPHR